MGTWEVSTGVSTVEPRGRGRDVTSGTLTPLALMSPGWAASWQARRHSRCPGMAVGLVAVPGLSPAGGHSHWHRRRPVPWTWRGDRARGDTCEQGSPFRFGHRLSEADFLLYLYLRHRCIFKDSPEVPGAGRASISHPRNSGTRGGLCLSRVPWDVSGRQGPGEVAPLRPQGMSPRGG